MLYFFIKSLLIGFLFGFLYGFLFVGKFKSLKKAGSTSILSFTLFSSVSHLLLISIFAFLIFAIKINIIVSLVCFFISFWWQILLQQKS
jgi:hypothetical protein